MHKNLFVIQKEQLFNIASWPTKPKIFIIWPFTEKVCFSLKDKAVEKARLMKKISRLTRAVLSKMVPTCYMWLFNVTLQIKQKFTSHISVFIGGQWFSNWTIKNRTFLSHKNPFDNAGMKGGMCVHVFVEQ